MFIQFIGINNKILNLSNIVLIEDRTSETDKETVLVLTTVDSTELEFTGNDADLILARCETLMEATDAFLNRSNLIN